jgi:deoxycytidine triphosphate deaminase
MIISPKIAIEKGWITGLKDSHKQVQPNAIDFTADRAFEVYTTADADFYISESLKQMRGSFEVSPSPTFYEQEPTNSWIIPGREMLDFLSDVYVDLPEGVAAQLVIRSTLARNGLLLVSGLYDSGFKGNIGFILHNRHSGDAIIAQGTRVGQIIFISADSAGTYTGGYNHEAGTVLEYQA